MAHEIWSDPVFDRLKELCQLPLSNAMIAQELSNQFHVLITRNAVIGKRLRSGLAQTPKEKRAPVQRLKRPKGLRFHGDRRRFNGHHTAPAPAVERRPIPIVMPHACDLMALRNESCRYPCDVPGKTGYFFCGEPEADMVRGRPYCIAHSWLVVRAF